MTQNWLSILGIVAIILIYIVILEFSKMSMPSKHWENTRLSDLQSTQNLFAETVST